MGVLLAMLYSLKYCYSYSCTCPIAFRDLVLIKKNFIDFPMNCSKNNNDVESENIYNIPKNDFNQQPQQQSAT